MRLEDVTPLILALDEEANLGRTLEALRWASQVVLLDSGSRDGTLAIAARHPNVKVCQRPFDDFAAQWNHGLSQVTTPFVLTLDADYVLDAGFADELRQLEPGAAAWSARFRYCIDGRPLRATLLPPRVVLFRTAQARYVNDGHCQALRHDAAVAVLRSRIRHDDRKPLARWLAAQQRYAVLEARKLRDTPWRRLGWPDRVRWLRLGPLLMPLYCLLAKGLLLDGRDGLFYTLQRTYAELLLVLHLADRGSRGP